MATMRCGWPAAIGVGVLSACGRTSGVLDENREGPIWDARASSDAVTEGGLASTFGKDPANPRLMLAATFDRRMVFVFTDGSTQEVHRFAVPSVEESFGETLRATIVSNGGRVAVTLTTDVRGRDGWQGFSETMLLTLAGEVIWQQLVEQPPHTHASPMLGDSGVLTRDEVAILADGREASLGGYQPVAEAFAGDVVPVRSSDGELGWLQLPMGTFSRASVQPDPSLSFAAIRVGEALVYDAIEGDTRFLVVARPGVEPHRIPLPAEAGRGQPAVFGEWLMIGYSPETGLFRVDLARGVVEEIDLEPPEGQRSFRNVEVDPSGVSLDDAGHVLALFRDEASGALYRSTDGRAPWLPVSRTFAHVNAAAFHGRGGTYTLSVRETGFFVPPPDLETEWSAPAAGDAPALDGGGTGLHRPASGVHHVAPAPVVLRISEDGGCAVYWERGTGEGGEDVLRAVDMDDGTSTPILVAPAERNFQGRDVVWIQAR
jgi:hypothetical protein